MPGSLCLISNYCNLNTMGMAASLLSWMIELSFYIEEGKTNIWKCLDSTTYWHLVPVNGDISPKRILLCQFIITHSLCGARYVAKPLEHIILPTMHQFFAKRCKWTPSMHLFGQMSLNCCPLSCILHLFDYIVNKSDVGEAFHTQENHDDNSSQLMQVFQCSLKMCKNLGFSAKSYP